MRVGLVLVAIVATASLAASALASTKPKPQMFMQVQTAKHHVDLTLIASDGTNNNGFNFDSYGRGELMVTVPLGWTITVHCKNDGPARNSCTVVSGPNATAPAFSGATTPNPVYGLVSGATASFTFKASRVGVFRIASMTPGRELARMYDVLEVTRGGRPSISARPGP